MPGLFPLCCNYAEQGVCCSGVRGLPLNGKGFGIALSRLLAQSVVICRHRSIHKKDPGALAAAMRSTGPEGVYEVIIRVCPAQRKECK